MGSSSTGGTLMKFQLRKEEKAILIKEGMVGGKPAA